MSTRMKLLLMLLGILIPNIGLAFQDTIEVAGEVMPARQIELRNTTGQNLTIIRLVNEGTLVQQGDVVVELDSYTFEMEVQKKRIEVDAAEMELKSRFAEYEQLYEQVEKQKKLLVEKLAWNDIEAKYFLGEKGKFAADQTRIKMSLELAKKKLEIFGRSKTDNSELKSEQELKVAEVEIEREALTQQLSYLVETEIPFRRKKFNHQKTVLTLQMESLVSESKLRLEQKKIELELGEAKLEYTKQEFEESKMGLDKCRLVSPSQGMVRYPNNERNSEIGFIEEGSVVPPNALLATIPDLSRMEIRAMVSESQIEKIEAGQIAIAYCDAYGEEEFKCAVRFVSKYPEVTWANNENRQYEIKLDLDVEGRELRMGMRCQVKIRIKD